MLFHKKYFNVKPFDLSSYLRTSTKWNWFVIRHESIPLVYLYACPLHKTGKKTPVVS